MTSPPSEISWVRVSGPIPVGFVAEGAPVSLDWLHHEPPVFVADPPSPSPLLVLDDLADVDGAAGGSTGDVLVKDPDGKWRPSPFDSEATPRSYSYNQLAGSEVWIIDHGLGFHPAGVTVHDSVGNIVEPTDIIYVSNNTIRLTFIGHPMSGVVELS